MLWNYVRSLLCPRPSLRSRFFSMHSSRTPSTSSKVGYAARISRSFHDSSAATPAETFGNFDLVRSFKLNYADVRVSRWRSRVTGLSVVHLDYEGTFTPRTSHEEKSDCLSSAPIVDGYLAVRTESKTEKTDLGNLC